MEWVVAYLLTVPWCDVVQSVWREEEVQGQSHRDLYPDNVTVQQPAPAASHSLTIDNKTNIQVQMCPPWLYSTDISNIMVYLFEAVHKLRNHFSLLFQ